MILLKVLVGPGDNCPGPPCQRGRPLGLIYAKNIEWPRISLHLNCQTWPSYIAPSTKFGRLDPTPGPLVRLFGAKTSNFGKQNSIKNLPAWEYLSGRRRPKSPLYRRLIVSNCRSQTSLIETQPLVMGMYRECYITTRGRSFSMTSHLINIKPNSEGWNTRATFTYLHTRSKEVGRVQGRRLG